MKTNRLFHCLAIMTLSTSLFQSCDSGFIANTNLAGDNTPLNSSGNNNLACAFDKHLEGTQCVPNFRSCIIQNGTGEELWNGTSFGSCTLKSCNTSFHQENNVCAPNSRSCITATGMGVELWDGTKYGACTVNSCNVNLHLEEGECVANARKCDILYGEGEEIWNGQEYSSCLVKDCYEGYHREDNQCVPNARSCDIDNGTGVQYWDGNQYTDCQAIACNDLYHVEDQKCVEDAQPCDYPNGVGVKFWREGQYGACQLKYCNSGYKVMRALDGSLDTTRIRCESFLGSYYFFEPQIGTNFCVYHATNSTKTGIHFLSPNTQRIDKYSWTGQGCNGQFDVFLSALFNYQSTAYLPVTLFSERSPNTLIEKQVQQIDVTLYTEAKAAEFRSSQKCGISNWAVGQTQVIRPPNPCAEVSTSNPLWIYGGGFVFLDQPYWFSVVDSSFKCVDYTFMKQ